MQIIDYPPREQEMSDADKERLGNLYRRLRGIFGKDKVVIVTAKASPDRDWVIGVDDHFDYAFTTKPSPSSSFLAFTRGKERK